MFTQIEKLFDDKIRPALAQHGGNVEVVDIDNDILFVKLVGGCQGCSSSKATVTGGIESVMKKNFPEIKQIVDLTDHDSGSNPYM
jgi:Fe-S cluster biogenesis protein NfuA